MTDLDEIPSVWAVSCTDNCCSQRSRKTSSGVFNYWVESAHKKDVPENLTQIEDVCIDISPSFIVGCTEYLRESQITFDKFHVVKEVNKAMDELRKIERKGNELLKGEQVYFSEKN